MKWKRLKRLILKCSFRNFFYPVRPFNKFAFRCIFWQIDTTEIIFHATTRCLLIHQNSKPKLPIKAWRLNSRFSNSCKLTQLKLLHFDDVINPAFHHKWHRHRFYIHITIFHIFLSLFYFIHDFTNKKNEIK